MKLMRLNKVTRITVVTEDGNIFEKYGAFEHGVELHIQDDGRTLKVMNAEKRTYDFDGV